MYKHLNSLDNMKSILSKDVYEPQGFKVNAMDFQGWSQNCETIYMNHVLNRVPTTDFVPIP